MAFWRKKKDKKSKKDKVEAKQAVIEQGTAPPAQPQQQQQQQQAQTPPVPQIPEALQAIEKEIAGTLFYLDLPEASFQSALTNPDSEEDKAVAAYVKAKQGEGPYTKSVLEDKLADDFARLAVESVAENFYPGLWIKNLQGLIENRNDLSLKIAAKTEQAFKEKAGYEQQAKTAARLIYDIKTFSYYSVLALSDEAIKVYLEKNGKTEDQIEEEFLTDMVQYAALARADGSYKNSWGAKLWQTAHVDPVLAAQAAGRDMVAQSLALKADAITQEDINDLVGAFQLAHQGSEDMVRRGYYFYATELVADLCKMAERVMAPDTQEAFRRYFSDVVKQWQARIDQNGDAKSKAVAEQALKECIAAQLAKPTYQSIVKPETQPQQPGPSSPAP